MVFMTKLFVAIILIAVACFYMRTIKNRRKRMIVAVLALLVISIATNKSIFWFVYFDGPYFGRVVDAETGDPLGRASIAGVWKYKYHLFQLFSRFASATETITDDDGRFVLPPVLAFSLWPFTTLESVELVVFKAGYDSHPPAIEVTPESTLGMSQSDKQKIEKNTLCSPWGKCLVKLKKALTVEEKRQAVVRARSHLGWIGIFMESRISMSSISRKLVNRHPPNVGDTFMAIERYDYKHADAFYDKNYPEIIQPKPSKPPVIIEINQDAGSVVLRDSKTKREYLVKQGDEVSGWRVTEIKTSSVTLLYSGYNGFSYSIQLLALQHDAVGRAQPQKKSRQPKNQ